MQKDKGPEIIAVGGGKGGVGKSFIAAGLATSLARRGYDTVIIDLDLGGANLHTLLGIKYPETGIGDFLYRPHSRDLLDYVTETGTRGLKLISGYGFIPGIANLNYFQKLKIIRAISRLENDYIILDLGAGTSYNVIDFFSMTESGIIVTNAEPTAVLNAYEFIKNVLFRMIEKQFSKNRQLLDLVKSHKKPGEHGESGAGMEALMERIGSVDQEAAALVRATCSGFSPALVINMASGPVAPLTEKLRAICRQFLSIDINILKPVPSDESVKTCLLRLKHVLVDNPDAPSARAICDMAEQLLQGGISLGRNAADVAGKTADVAGERLAAGDREDRELAALISDFYSGFQENGTAAAQDAGNSSPGPDHFIKPEMRFDQNSMLPRFLPISDFSSESDFFNDSSSALARIMSIADAEDALLAMESQEALQEKRIEIAEAWLSCGYTLLGSNQQKSAFKAFIRAYGLMPDSARISISAGAALLAQGRPAEALEILAKALKRHPSNPLLLYNHALAHFRLEQHGNCLESIELLASGGNLDGKAMALGACAAFRLERFSRALEFMSSLNGSGPWNRDLLSWNRAAAMIRDGKYQEAVMELDGIIKNSPEDSEAFAARGAALWQMQDMDAAIADLDRAVKLNASDINYRAARGTAAFHAGLLDKAVRDMEIITRLRPDNIKFRSLLDAINARLGE